LGIPGLGGVPFLNQGFNNVGFGQQMDGMQMFAPRIIVGQ